jgi:uncharacterized protein
MKTHLLAVACLALVLPGFAQTADTDPATKDDVILLLRTMHTHDLMHRLMEVQSKGIRQLMHDQLAQDKQLPANFDARMEKSMDDLIKHMPVDEMTQAMIPAYQKHFTHGDIEAMNTFYASPVGQKVLQELPEVSQEGMQAIVPILNKYLSEWKDRTQQDMKRTNSASPQKDPPKTN